MRNTGAYRSMSATLVVFPNYDQLHSRPSVFPRPIAHMRVNKFPEVLMAALNLRTVDLRNAFRRGDC